MREPLFDQHFPRWNGLDAITGKSAEWYASMLQDCKAPLWAQRSAVRVCRSYNIQGQADPAYIANVIMAEAAKDKARR